MKKLHVSKKNYHHIHLVAHLGYLVLVAVGSTHYYLAAGTLGIIVVIGEFVENKEKE